MAPFARKLAILRQSKQDAELAPIGARDDLFIGSIGAARNVAALRAVGITHVVSAVSADDADFRAPGIAYLHCDVRDAPDEDLAAHFLRASDFIARALGSGDGGSGSARVLVHCFQGKSRSASLVCAHLMRAEGLGFLEALEEVRVHRPTAQPNLGFVAQLRRWEKAQRGGADKGPGAAAEAPIERLEPAPQR